MAVPSSGQLCLRGITREKAYDSYTCFYSPPVVSPFKGYELQDLSDGTQYGTINTNSPSYPDGTAPHCMSEWYGYDHDAAGSGAWRTMSATIALNCWVSSAGTVPAAMVSQGRSIYSPYAATSCTQEFNGTSWSAGGTNTNARKGLNNSAIGTQNAALAFGGCYSFPACRQTSEYNGSTWSNSNSVPTGIMLSATAGNQNSAILAGGCTPGVSTCVREYNGSTWSSAACLPGGRLYGGTGVGTQNAFLITGGRCGTYIFCCATREYNGLSWSAGGNLSTKRYYAAGAGNQNDAKVAGGCYCYTGPTRSLNTVEDYNGTTWSTGTSLPDCRHAMASGGTTACMWAVGGSKYGSPLGCVNGYIWD